MWIVLLMYALFASVFTVGKHTLQSVDPFFLTGIRMLIAGLILLSTSQHINARNNSKGSITNPFALHQGSPCNAGLFLSIKIALIALFQRKHPRVAGVFSFLAERM